MNDSDGLLRVKWSTFIKIEIEFSLVCEWTTNPLVENQWHTPTVFFTALGLGSLCSIYRSEFIFSTCSVTCVGILFSQRPQAGGNPANSAKKVWNYKTD